MAPDSNRGAVPTPESTPPRRDGKCRALRPRRGQWYPPLHATIVRHNSRRDFVWRDPICPRWPQNRAAVPPTLKGFRLKAFRPIFTSCSNLLGFGATIAGPETTADFADTQAPEVSMAAAFVDSIQLPRVDGEPEDEKIVRPSLAILFRMAVGPGADYYAPRFLEYERVGRSFPSWNWAPLLAPAVWAIYRRLWLAGIGVHRLAAPRHRRFLVRPAAFRRYRMPSGSPGRDRRLVHSGRRRRAPRQHAPLSEGAPPRPHGRGTDHADRQGRAMAFAPHGDRSVASRGHDGGHAHRAGRDAPEPAIRLRRPGRAIAHRRK